MIYVFSAFYLMVAYGYGTVVSEREPSRFNWVCITTGLIFPMLLGVTLCHWFYNMRIGGGKE